MKNVSDRVYDLTNPEDVVDLASAVQVSVYWGSTFYDKDEECVGYHNFWDYCGTAVSEGCTKVKITVNDEVHFMK